MDRIRQLIHEAHRRSLWQVLSVYLVGAWGALQVVESITENAGLPDWVPASALILLVVGLPIVLATAVVQVGIRERNPDDRGVHEGEVHSDVPDGAEAGANAELGKDEATSVPGAVRGSKRKRVFTWRNAAAGGVAAFALLGLVVGGYFVMWSAGIGPIGSLAAQGVFEDGEGVILAEFENATSDSLLGSVVTEALRMDLHESSALSVVDPSLISRVLERMERPEDTRVTGAVAQEVAVREGLKAVIQGEIGAVGSGYVLTATLTEAESGRTLAAFRETAEGEEKLIGAIDKLSQDIREKSGESLLSIKSGVPLVNVTTSSLEALRKYSQGVEVADQGDAERGAELMEEAIAEDSTFAMAWRKLAVLRRNTGAPEETVDEAATRAYELRERLSDTEKYLTEAQYHQYVTEDDDRAKRAYRNVLETEPDSRTALNNLAILLSGEEALELLDRAVSGPGESTVAHDNRIRVLLDLERVEEASEALDLYESRYPNDYRVYAARAQVSYLLQDWATMERAAEAGLERFGPGFENGRPLHDVAVAETARGKMEEAEDHLRLMAEDDSLAEGHLLGDLVDLDLLLRGDSERAVSNLDRNLSEGLRFAAAGTEAERKARELWTRIQIEAVAGRESRALAFVEEWLTVMKEVDPDDPPTEANPPMAAGIALGAGRWEDALDIYSGIRQRNDCDPCWSHEIGRALFGMERWEEASAEFRKHQIQAPFSTWKAASDLENAELLAQAHERAGDNASAIEVYLYIADRWSPADDELQPRIEAARNKASTLGGN